MCVVYSVGLADDISFDLAVDALGCEVFAYDHTIGHLPPTIDTLTNNIKWTQWGVGVLPEPPNPQQKYIKTFIDLLETNAHEYIDMLKIDIEGSEWAFLRENLDNGELKKRVGQFCLEIHFESQGHGVSESNIMVLEDLVHSGFELYYRSDNYIACPQVYWLPPEFGVEGVRRCHNICYINKRFIAKVESVETKTKTAKKPKTFKKKAKTPSHI